MSLAANRARERAKRIIAELRNKTEDNGCTEAEAMSAAEQIGELLEKYDIEIDEIGVREDADQCRKNEVFAADEFAGTIVTGIAKFCTLIVYQVKNDGHGCKYVFFGTPHDLELGAYLYEVCAEAMEYDWATYMEDHGYSMKKRASFRMGFSQRVYQRLQQMKAERDARNASSCRSLVVLKDQLVRQEFDALGIHLRKGSGRRVAADGHAFGRGQAAGDKVNLGNPLGGPGGSGYLR